MSTIPHRRGWPTTQEAEHSKRYLAGGYLVAENCPCGMVHLDKVTSASKATARKPAQPDTFPPAVCALLDTRDSDDSTGHPVRIAQCCGATRNLHRHHRRSKDAGGSSNRPHAHCACNGLTLCLRHHRWAHDHPEAARAMGWIVSQSVDEPATEGVMRFAAAEGGATQRPTCDGRWAEYELAAGVA